MNQDLLNDEWEDARLIGYRVGYGHDELFDMYDDVFPTLEDAIKFAKDEYQGEIDDRMDDLREYYPDETPKRADAKERAFSFYIGEEREGFEIWWFKTINHMTGRLSSFDVSGNF